MEAFDMKFVQCFGEKEYHDEYADGDIVTAVEFDHTGQFLAAGDKGGKIWIFRQGNGPEYRYYADFQSHELEFDYLKSSEIEERINQIKWLKRQNHALFLLATNDKTVKLWKLHEKKIKSFAYTNAREESKSAGPLATIYSANGNSSATGSLAIPRVTSSSLVVAATPRRVYANAHAYHINSVSLNSDCETFISTDDLRINLWNLDINDQSFNIVDIKPELMEDLTEVITTASFHPSHCNIFMYSSSRGCIRLADMRANALCDQHAKIFEEPEDPSNQSFFSEIMSSISDAKFTPDGRYIISRDYLTLKLWDVNMDSTPVSTIPIHDYLRAKLCDLYDNDYIFDKFECAPNRTGDCFITGSYNNNFLVTDRTGNTRRMYEASRTPVRKGSKAGGANGKLTRTKRDKRGGSNGAINMPAGAEETVNPDQIDYTKKALHLSWHPMQNTVAVASLNNLYIYSS